MSCFLRRLVPALCLLLPFVGHAAVTAITYQGFLKDGTLPANGTYDMQFQPFYAETDTYGRALPITLEDVTVTDGRFSVSIDFGTIYSTEQECWLQISVRPGASTGEFTTLSPRQRLTPVPTALHAFTAINVDNAWGFSGNSSAGGRFIGTYDRTRFLVKVNGKQAFLVEPNPVNDTISPIIVGGYYENTAGSSFGTTISGGGESGSPNTALGSSGWGAICGGSGNQVDKYYSTVLGGYKNTAGGNFALAGGSQSSATGSYAVALGDRCVANGSGSVAMGIVCKAESNSAVALGYLSTANKEYAMALGYKANTNAHKGAFVWSDSSDTANAFLAQADHEFALRAAGGVRMVVGTSLWHLQPHTTSPNILAGSNANDITAGVYGGVVAGGGKSGYPNRVTDNFGTVSGGYYNSAGDNAGTTADREYATVAGGNHNQASGQFSAIGGGLNNIASGASSVIAGGNNNNAFGDTSTVPGGVSCGAIGNFSFAAGNRAKANHTGSFVWADTSDTNVDFGSERNNQMRLRAAGGVRLDVGNSGWVNIWKSSSSATRLLDTSTGAYLSTTGVWTDNSDRNLKTDFTPVNGRAILKKVLSLPITTWRYQADTTALHLGPMAQDFHAAFGLGDDDKHLATLDEAGVALAALQGLYQLTREENTTLKSRVTALEQQNTLLLQRLAALEKAVKAQR